MFHRDWQQRACERAARCLARAGIAITAKEKQGIEVADYGLGDPECIGLQILVYVNEPRYCAKELVMLPRQTCPEHRHPPIDGGPGKQETFRCRWGRVYLYVPGEPAPKPKAVVPARHAHGFTVWHEIILGPGEQCTLPSDTRHWFQAGDQGAIVSEFSSCSHDELDLFTDGNIRRFGREP